MPRPTTTGRTRFCAPLTVDPAFPDHKVAGRLCDHLQRTLPDSPIVGQPTRHARLPRSACSNHDRGTRIIRQQSPPPAEPRTTTTRRCTKWILQRFGGRPRQSFPRSRQHPAWVGPRSTTSQSAPCWPRSTAAGVTSKGVRTPGVDERRSKHVRGDDGSVFVTVPVDLHTAGRQAPGRPGRPAVRR